ncbi:MAG: GTP-binding protein [Nitrospiraceae bacterium]|nr:GTP-binding protein [Nitrospiraceae bacterium]
MTDAKVCMLGAFAVGKTSLVRRFVTSQFSDQYHTTIGVKVDKKTQTVDGHSVNLILWDLYGEDDYQKLRLSYLRGASAYLLVLDGTRRTTLNVARQLQRMAEDALGSVPFIVLANKADLVDEWEVTQEELDELVRPGWRLVTTSAKTGEGVEQAFQLLTESLIRSDRANTSAPKAP